MNIFQDPKITTVLMRIFKKSLDLRKTPKTGCTSVIPNQYPSIQPMQTSIRQSVLGLEMCKIFC